MRKTGSYQTLGSIDYFIPDPLPPANPSLELTPEIMALYGQASFALGTLNQMCKELPNQKQFIKAYIIKEALLSSAIEGIHTTLIEVFTQVLGDSKANKNTQLVLNYTHALDKALSMLNDQGLPLVTRVILESHKALMSTGEGDSADPGHFRKQSVRVGELVPPPASEIVHLMSSLEKYIHDDMSDIPPLIKAGLVHVHFETIHPFLDGNGRIGRLLIVLMLMESNLLDTPILYPSYYFKKHHYEYYQKLDRVRTHGDFEGWITYFLKAIRDSALDAHKRAQEIKDLELHLKNLVENHKDFVKMQETTIAVIEYLFYQPITTIAKISKKLNKAYNTIHNVLSILLEHTIITENIVHKRNKVYRFYLYLKVLEKQYND